jgi:hypothetical protein
VKAWGRAFQELSASFRQHPSPVARSVSRPVLDWDLNIIDTKARDAFRESYFQAFKASEKNEHPTSNFKP